MAEAARQSETTLSNQPDEESVIAVNLFKIRDAIGEKKEQAEDYKATLEHAASKGVNLKAAKKALAIIAAGDASSWLIETQEITRYLRILRHGIQESQLSLSFESHLAPLDEKAALDGRAAGLAGQSSSDCPHDPSTEAAQAWLKAYGEGLSERTLILSMGTDDEEGED